jgi:hypothetical protein
VGRFLRGSWRQNASEFKRGRSRAGRPRHNVEPAPSLAKEFFNSLGAFEHRQTRLLARRQALDSKSSGADNCAGGAEHRWSLSDLTCRIACVLFACQLINDGSITTKGAAAYGFCQRIKQHNRQN